MNNLDLDEGEYDKMGTGKEEALDYIESNGINYKVVPSLLKFAHIIFDFIKLVRNFPEMAHDTANKLLDLLKVNFHCSIIDV
jgi:hypothetical protein